MKSDELLEREPYDLDEKEKQAVYAPALKESFGFHYNNCPQFKSFVDSQGFDMKSDYALEDMPYLPIGIFKEVELVTGSKDLIKTMIKSSATTSGKPSMIPLDDITAKRQQVALRKIMSSYMGTDRMLFIVLDARSTASKQGIKTSSRASAIRGLSQFAKSMKFILDDDLKLDVDEFKKAVAGIENDQKICIFGFTWLIYKVFLGLQKDKAAMDMFTSAFTHTENIVLHIGGWKKLKDIAVEKEQFNKEIGSLCNSDHIIDFYGMTEQLGTVYPDCKEGYKHVPLYSDLIIRDPATLEPLGIKKAGLMQLSTPIPNSYPGINLLTEDIGEIRGIDDCKCGRRGKYFLFRKRSEKAPIKGCGDTL
ncbi:MAG: GH3 auxin-responsive promoter family protein [Nanoarchaeota archaeon]|nr:GH3 auxin-responsive promoter family protein [Nanoarchaeota archaeon]